MSYFLKVKKISVVYESSDSVVIITGYLTNAAGMAFKNANDEVDTFTIRAPKSSVPPSGILAYLTDLAQSQFSLKYNQQLSGLGSNASDILTLSETDIKKVFIDHTVSGVGITTTENVDSIKSTTEIILSGNLTLSYTGNTTSPSFTKTGDVASGSNVITNMSSTSNILGGMTVAGYGIPSGAVVSTINSVTEIVISQNALASSVGAILTFATDAECNYLSSLSPAIFTTGYENLSVTGPAIPKNTTVLEVISTSRLKLSQPATATTTGGTYVISGSPKYLFDASGWTVDYSALQKVVDIIDFTEL